MADQEIFNRGFENVKDNEDSKIGDCIHEALDLVTATITEPHDEGDISLSKAFKIYDGDDARDRIKAVHEYLGSDFLDVTDVFSSRKKARKVFTNLSFPSSDIQFLNTAIRTAGENSLNCLYYSR